MVETYEEAAKAFERGEIDFEELKWIVLKLPPPDPIPRARTVDEVYELAEVPPSPNSFTWIAGMTLTKDLTIEQVNLLAELAAKTD